jgi:hypothetical protein
MHDQSKLRNAQMRSFEFLSNMYESGYFPHHLVDKCKFVLIELCANIEKLEPKSLDALYALTHAATEQINDLEEEFFENDSEIETEAAECIAIDMYDIALAYGFDADMETLIQTRNW